jgi:2-polyprenyl-3-methyl-5-hydroxy-6-metoxy-1,4-benzoquinol methylase
MSNSNQQAVAQHFDDYAARHVWQDHYERGVNRHTVAYALRLDAYAQLLRELQPTSVLDLGCGSGDFLAVLPSSAARYHGVDISAEMIRAVQEKIDQLPAESQAYTTCETCALEAFKPRGMFDFVLASGLIEYFEDVGPVVKTMADIVAPGGYVATQVPNRHYYKFKGIRHWQSEGKSFRHHRMSREECDTVHREAGLEKVRGYYLDNLYLPKLRKWLPKIHYFLCSHFDASTPEFFSRKFATMYLGLYRKPRR